mmetsp:Transcript_16028/g.33520  ORF Transcript_16028/g.33520 Transcript_16028/m.33520 type:complete len:449 (+) Transcript_16028:38-1384(+)
MSGNQDEQFLEAGGLSDDDDSMNVDSMDEDDEDDNDTDEDGMRDSTTTTAATYSPASVAAAAVSASVAQATSTAQQSGRINAVAAAGAHAVAAADSASEKRKTIQAIMRDASLTDLERRLRIQRLMDGSSQFAAGGKSGATSGRAASLLGTTAGSLSLLPISASTSTHAASGSKTAGDDGDEVVACVHYERKCNIVAPCCGGIFGCRVCHDEINSACGPMDRFAIKEIVCKECRTRQSSKTNTCCSCGITFAEYHCLKCNIWMASNKRPFHCDECGFCRVGGSDNFRHCSQCCMCISVTVYETHNCMRDKYKNNCPVCREDMFSSRQPPQDLPCGHAIHAHCFRNLAAFDYRCPICKKTVVSRNSMSAAWQARARDIEMQPMPEDLARIVNIHCNDCETKSAHCSWHFLGVQCPGCRSFNTVVETVVHSGSGGQLASGSNGGQSSESM